MKSCCAGVPAGIFPNAFSITGKKGFLFEVAGYDDESVGRVVVAGVESLYVLDRQPLDIIRPSNDRPVIRLRTGTRRPPTAPAKKTADCHRRASAFFENDHPLRAEIAFSQDQIAHAVGFEIDGHPDPVRAKRFEIPHRVVRRGGVLLPSQFIDRPDELLTAYFGGTFEHHVLEHMREPGFAGFFVPRPGPVPDLKRYDWGFVVFEHNDFKAVREPASAVSLNTSARGKRRKQEIP